MSEARDSERHPRAEEDAIATRKIVAVGVTAIVIFLLGSVAATWVLSKRREALLPQGPPPVPAEAGQPKIGILEQPMFENMRTAEELRAEQLERLGSYGWVDRATGTIHIPIEEAMKRVAGGRRP
jgi:hypothetical protein